MTEAWSVTFSSGRVAKSTPRLGIRKRRYCAPSRIKRLTWYGASCPDRLTSIAASATAVRLYQLHLSYLGNTAVHIAAKNKDKLMIQLLSKYQVNFKSMNNSGESVFEILKS